MAEQKGFTGILIIVILVGVLAGGYLIYQRQAKPTPPPQQIIQPSPIGLTDKIASWKTYTNEEFGFLVKYPSGFHVTKKRFLNRMSEGDPKDGGALSTEIPYNPDNPGGTTGKDITKDITIDILVITKPEKQSFEDFIEKKILTQLDHGSRVKITPSLRKNIEIDGRKAVWLEGISFYSPTHIEVVIDKEATTIIHMRIVEGTGNAPEKAAQYAENVSLINQILSTFQFLPDWKTFSFGDTGLELKYPPNWKIKTISAANTQQISLYPPGSDPQLPSKNITFSLSDTPYEPAPTPAEYMSRYKPIVVAGITGRVSEYLLPKEGELRLPLVGGECQEPVQIELPVKNKMLFISSCKDLELNLQEILKTVIVL